MNLFSLYARRQMAVPKVAARMLGAKGGGLAPKFQPRSVQALFRPSVETAYGTGYDMLSSGVAGLGEGLTLIGGKTTSFQTVVPSGGSSFVSQPSGGSGFVSITKGAIAPSTSGGLVSLTTSGTTSNRLRNLFADPSGMGTQVNHAVRFEKMVLLDYRSMTRTELWSYIQSLLRHIQVAKDAISGNPANKAELIVERDTTTKIFDEAVAYYEQEVRAEDARRLAAAKIEDARLKQNEADAQKRILEDQSKLLDTGVNQGASTAAGGFNYWWLAAGAAGLAVVAVVFKGRK